MLALKDSGGRSVRAAEDSGGRSVRAEESGGRSVRAPDGRRVRAAEPRAEPEHPLRGVGLKKFQMMIFS